MIGPGRRTPTEWAIMLIGCELAVINLGLGAALLFGLPSRTAAVSFTPIKDLAPIHWWGVAFILTGLLAITCQALQRFKVVAAAHAAAGFACLFWAIAFLSGLNNPNVTATGIWAYLGLGLTHWTVAAVASVEARWRV